MVFKYKLMQKKKKIISLFVYESRCTWISVIKRLLSAWDGVDEIQSDRKLLDLQIFSFHHILFLVLVEKLMLQLLTEGFIFSSVEIYFFFKWKEKTAFLFMYFIVLIFFLKKQITHSFFYEAETPHLSFHVTLNQVLYA